MDRQRISYIMGRYLDDSADLSELQELKEILNDKKNEDFLKEMLVEKYYSFTPEKISATSNAVKDEGLKLITSFPQKKTKSLIHPLFYAAAALIVITLSVLFFSSQKVKDNTVKIAAVITPGKYGATLTLSDGRKIQLANSKPGQLANEGGIKITKNRQGKLQYTGIGENENLENKVSTTQGQTYELILPDGSKVWLNSATTLSYKASLTTGGERQVRLSGEAYFEIQRNEKLPFVVLSANQKVVVLGTHFNINSYAEDSVHTTTLLEGSVKINEKILKPNQQALQHHGKIQIAPVDPLMATDWKNGEFKCVNTPLFSLMDKISRWYDVEIIFLNNSSRNRTFSGSLSRYDNLNDLLKVLEFANIKSRTKDRTVYITN